MALWMYIFVFAMFLVAIVGTVWITLWTIQRGERARSERSAEPKSSGTAPGTES